METKAMKLYTHGMSSSARRVNLTVAHLGLQIETRQIDLRRPEDRAELVAVNPNNKIPVLVDRSADITLWESHAIAQYLCDRDGGAAAKELYPTEIVARAEVHRWLYWVNAHLAPAVGPISFEKLWKRFVDPKSAGPDEAIVARYERFLHAALGVMDKHLAGRSWLVGKTLTLADYSVVSTLMYRVPTALPLDPYQNVLQHIARVEGTPAWKATEPPKQG
jgi:glutathione S-transferase